MNKRITILKVAIVLTFIMCMYLVCSFEAPYGHICYCKWPIN